MPAVSKMVAQEDPPSKYSTERGKKRDHPDNVFDTGTGIENQLTKPIVSIEMQLAILENIHDPETLMSCRLVNWNWNVAANQQLVKIGVAHWQTWLSEPENLETPQNCKVSTVLHHKRMLGFAYINMPPALKKSNHRWNPFPAKSLTICSTPDQTFWEKVMPTRSLKWNRLFIKFGSCLTTLTLSEVKVQPFYIHSLLVNTPNLKALTFDRVQHLWPDKFHFKFYKKICSASKNVSEHLEYLRVYGKFPGFWTRWILVLVAHQLVHLTLNRFCPGLLAKERRQFPKLRELKICLPDFDEYFKVVSPNSGPVLESLTIRLNHNWYNDYHDVASFIACFKESLKHLCLNVELAELMKYYKVWRANNVVFSELKSLVLETSAGGVDWKKMLQNKKRITVAPKIEKVEFVTFPEHNWMK